MPDLTVKTIYEAVVRGYGKVEEISRLNERLQQDNTKLKEAVNRVSAAQERQESALLKSRQAVISFRRELFIFTVIAGSTAGILRSLGKDSEALSGRLEGVTDWWRNLTGAVGDAVAQLTTAKGLMASLANLPAFGFIGVGQKAQARSVTDHLEDSRKGRMQRLQLESQIAALEGNSLLALRKKHQADQLRLEQEFTKKRLAELQPYYNRIRENELESLRLAELGLKRRVEIAKDLRRDLVAGFQSQTGNTIFKFLQGEKQSGMDVLKGFRETINRAISDAISGTLFTTLATGGNFFRNFADILKGETLATRRQSETNEILKNNVAEKLTRIQEAVACVCANTGRLSGFSGGRIEGTITPPSVGILDKVGAVANLVGAVAGLGKGGPNVTMAPGTNIPRFQTGGEVPAILHGGEFVVNRTAAQTNRELLRDINAGGGGKLGNNFFIKIDAVDSQSFERRLASPSAREAIGMQVVRLVAMNSEVRRVIKEFA